MVSFQLDLHFAVAIDTRLPKGEFQWYVITGHQWKKNIPGERMFDDVICVYLASENPSISLNENIKLHTIIYVSGKRFR